MATAKVIAPIVIVGITALIASLIWFNPPQPNRQRPKSVTQMTVEVQTLVPRSYAVVLDSFGHVKPRTESVLVAQIGGQINAINSQFRDGGFFEQGDVLLKIDDRDYQAEVKIAQSALLSAQQNLLEEQARAQQALVDWERLGNGKQANDLVLRKPQLGAAQAQVLSAQAQLDKAQLKIERSQVIAPYAGRILKKKVDFGQVISVGSALADIYAVDTVEIRLPIKNKDLALMDLPEEYRDSGKVRKPVPVTFKSELVGEQSWQGEVVRTEGAIDNNAQQLYIVAQIADPYRKDQNGSNKFTVPIKIGQYVTAQINGKVVEQAMVIPNSAIYQGSYVYILADGLLIRKNIQIRWQNSQDAIIDAGLEFGQALVLTALGQISSGTPASILGDVAADGVVMDNKPGKKGDNKRRRPPIAPSETQAQKTSEDKS